MEVLTVRAIARQKYRRDFFVGDENRISGIISGLRLQGQVSIQYALISSD